VVGKTVIPPPPVITTGAAEQELAADLEQIQELTVDEPVAAASPRVIVPQGRRSIPAASLVPPVPQIISSRSAEIDRRLSNKSPQTMILYGIITFVAGCIGAMVLSAANANGVLVGLIIVAAALGGFALIVLGFVLAIARYEGRRR
jgi:VIT1/CCC1 family predicted Fe2+/Mn2+ transporter